MIEFGEHRYRSIEGIVHAPKYAQSPLAYYHFMIFYGTSMILGNDSREHSSEIHVICSAA